MTKKSFKNSIQPVHVLAALFLCFILYVGAAAVPAFLKNTLQTLQEPLNPLGYIQKINEQYSGMLETGKKYAFFQNKGTYINLNGAMARLFRQPAMNERVTLKNGHLSRVLPEEPNPEEIRQAADNIIQFHNAHTASGGDFLFVMVPSQISKYEDLLPAGYTDTTNATADTFLTMLQASGVPYLDLREELEADGISITDAYYSTDHHWNIQTAFWAYGKILDALTEIKAIEPVDSFFTDPENYIFETYENSFLGSSGKRTGIYYAGVDDSVLLRPAFDTEISVSIPQLEVNLTGRYEDVSYNTDIAPDFGDPNFFGDNIYGSYGWGDTQITHWRNENAPIQEKFLLIGESFGNVPFSLMSLCFSSCDEIDMRHFTEDFSQYYHSYRPETVVLLFYVRNTISEFTDTSYLG